MFFLTGAGMWFCGFVLFLNFSGTSSSVFFRLLCFVPGTSSILSFADAPWHWHVFFCVSLGSANVWGRNALIVEAIVSIQPVLCVYVSFRF